MLRSPRRRRSSRRRVAVSVTVSAVVALIGSTLTGGPADAAQRLAAASATTATGGTATTSGSLLTGDTVSLMGGIGSWTGTNVVPLTNLVYDNGASAALVVTAQAAGPVVVQTGVGTSAVAAAPGSVYSGSLRIAAGTTGNQVYAALAWYGATGAEISAERVSSAMTSDRVGGWTSLIVSGIAPAGAAYVSLVAGLPYDASGQTHYIDSPSLTVGPSGSRSVAGPLHTTGNTIYDANNAPVVLRGMNRWGSYNPASDNLTQYDIGRIKAWGGNVVRLTLIQDVWLPGCATYNPNMPGIVDQAVKWVTGAGMVAILDLQWNAPTCATSGLNPMPDRNSTVFWQQVAKRYANQPLVAFDLFNEPHDVSDAVWLNGGAATTKSGVTYTAVGMKSLYDTVRHTGAKNLVFVGGLGYASIWPTTAPIAGTSNVVYAVHAYNCDTPAACTNGNGASWLLDRFVVPGQSNPIMVTEFGWPAAGVVDAQIFNTNVITYAEQHGWGWMPWTWDVNGNCDVNQWWDLIATGSCKVGGTYQPAPAGMPILTGLRKNT